ncbi:MAG: hypothetical protein IT374_02910 [Polyangiaceae bacterium]|nr:hypothetical protein [Polyangiaceae bacterium]
MNRNFTASFLAAAALLTSGAALAQDPPPPPAPAPGPGAATGSEKVTDGGPSAHSQVVGTFAITWFGVGDVPIAAAQGARQAVATPAVGARYWLNEKLGIDAGLGFSQKSGSTETVSGGTTVTTDQPSSTAFWLHVGVPLALAHAGNFTFLVTPELNYGSASGKIKGTPAMGMQPAGPDTDLSGSRILAGARAGAEIHFGFMGLRRLSLEGSVGLFYDSQSWKASSTQNGTEVSAKGSETIISTSSINQPWDFFRGNVAARYYF